MGLAKAVSAAILEEDILLAASFLCPPLPEGTFAGESGPPGRFHWLAHKAHFARTLRLILVLRVGVGCRRGISAEAVVRCGADGVRGKWAGTRRPSAASVPSTWQDEAGLLAACEKNNWPVHFYGAAAADVAGDFTPLTSSAPVTGVDNVCERRRCWMPKN